MDPSLTFGIELEFVAVYAHDTFANTDWSDLVKDRDVKDRDVKDGQYVDIHHALHYFFRKYGLIPSYNGKNSEPYTTWSIKEELTRLTPAELALLPDNYTQRSVEISSPILHINNPNCFAHIQQVLNILQWLEQNFSCHFLTNSTCGLHIHFAQGSQPFSIECTKRIHQLFLAYECSIDSIHASTRTTANTWTRDIPESEFHRPDFTSLSSLHVNGHLYPLLPRHYARYTP